MERLTVSPIELGPEVETLLIAGGLPVSDLGSVADLHLFGMRTDHELIGLVAVEAYATVGLLRSLAVAERHRGAGHGRALVAHAEAWAAQDGLKALYLLTETAAQFFSALGYRPAARSEAPPAIAATSQFTTFCPESATLMRKALLPAKPSS
jgi:N-acetylglutamate synthase-like GNAT family acetyltransferase